MTNSLVAWAHPEPSSFTVAWARASLDAARHLGNAAQSDLYGMQFDPAERGSLYGVEGPFDPLKTQEQAVSDGNLPPDLKREVQKIAEADLLVLHFPIWWFGPPAMLKGWLDRALVHGALHRVDERFDKGPCRGKRALMCVSTGCSASECGPDGRQGDLRMLLWPLAQTLRYCGFTVLEPVSVHEVHGYHPHSDRIALEAQLSKRLQAQRALIEGVDSHPVWPFNQDEDFGPDRRLKPQAPSHDPFIRHL